MSNLTAFFVPKIGKKKMKMQKNVSNHPRDAPFLKKNIE